MPGQMKDYEYQGSPWYGNTSKITSISVATDVFSIGSYAFDGCSSADTVLIYGTITSWGEHCFDSVTPSGLFI